MNGPLVGVGVRTVTLGGLPLLVAAVPSDGPGGQLLARVAERGLVPLQGVTGVELPRGARLGFVVDRSELRLVDDTDATLLRAPREGLDADWLGAALRLKGTMTVVGRDLEVDADLPVAELVGRLDVAAGEGRVLGAIVGLLEERPTLPLFL